MNREDDHGYRTLTLEDAAHFLHLHPAVLRRKARKGEIPAAKPGKRWVFLENDLVAYLRALYAARGQAPLSGCTEESVCHFSNAAPSGGLISPRPTATAYATLLGLATESKHRNTTTD